MKTFSLSPLLEKFAEPETLKMAQMARELQAKGKKVIGLSLGEPDFDTPVHIKEAALKAMQENWTHYSPVNGFLDLREAICEKLAVENNLDYKPTEIVVSTGAKQSIANLIYAMIAEGDEVIIPAPFWVSYSEIVRMAGGTPIIVATSIENDFKITPQQLEKNITKKTKLFMFSSPCNPTGSFYHKSELEQLAKVFEKYPHVFIMSDEIYEYINYVGKHASIAEIPSMKERTAVINGFSKGFAMTGWRLGYLAAPKYVVDACTKIQGQVTSGANSIAQKAAVVALKADKTPCKEMTKIFAKRKKLMLDLVRAIPEVVCAEPEGAFYVFPKVDAFFGKSCCGMTIHSSADLSMYLLEHGLVSSVSGQAFGTEGYIRFSYATSEQNIQQAMLQVKEALSKLA